MQNLDNTLNDNINDNYNGVAKFLHWLIALLIISNYILGLTLDSTSWYNLHKQIGLTILVLVILRIVWRLISKYPKPLASISPIETKAAGFGQLLLYFLMISVPLSGIFMVQSKGYPLSLWGILPLPELITKQPQSVVEVKKTWHLWLANAIIIIAAGHALIALIHHFFTKNDLLLRMLPKSMTARK